MADGVPDPALGMMPQTHGDSMSGQRFAHIFVHLPVCLWQTDDTELVHRFDTLRDQGVKDLDTYIDRHPEFPQQALRLVQVQLANTRAVQLFGGRSSGDFAGTPVDRYWQDHPQTFRRSMCARFSGAQSYTEETEILDRHGRVIPMELSIAFLPPLDGRYVSVVGAIDIRGRFRNKDAIPANALRDQALFRDIALPGGQVNTGQALDFLDELKRRYGESLAAYMEKAADFPPNYAATLHLQADFAHAAKMSLIDELARSIAHEVNQPLTAIIGTGEIMQRWLAAPAPDIGELQSLAADIVEDGYRAAAILTRIRAMMDKKPSGRQRVCLNEVVDEAMIVFQRAVRLSGIQLDFKPAPDLPQMRVDRIQIQQVLVNLLTNAVEAIEGGRSPLRAVSIATTMSGPSEVEVSVIDSGPGIDPEMVDRIFESFVSSKEGKLGIGLTVCRTILEAHGGRISAVNDVVGAKFSFRLPVAPDQEISDPGCRA